MHIRYLKLLSAVLLACCVAAQAADDGHRVTEQGVEALSAPLREALGAEMVALQNGLMTVIPAFVAGRWDEVAGIGRQMHDSYIMKQSLSAAQVEELHQAMPASFLELDARFHDLAAMLQHAAEVRKPELVGFYLGRLAETCVTCHALHARGKFPAYAEPAAPDGHDH